MDNMLKEELVTQWKWAASEAMRLVKTEQEIKKLMAKDRSLTFVDAYEKVIAQYPEFAEPTKRSRL